MGTAVVTLILLGLSLAMDAFTVSVVDGLTLRNLTRKRVVIIALFFGLFQGLFPLVGHLIGSTFMGYIEDYDHWIALALLTLIGGKMIYDGIKEAIKKKKGETLEEKDFSYRLVFFQAVATAIDAFAVGITLQSSITPISVYIGVAVIIVITFLLCLCGGFLGSKIANLIHGHMEIATIFGGVVLILIGVKIVLSHLGYIPF